MSSARKSAIWVGALWIMATVFPVLSILPWSALDDSEGILANAATHKSQLITWVLLNLVGAVAAAGVAFMLYPILNRVADTSVREGLALWYVGTRITESGIYVVAVLATWAFLPLSREFAAAGAPDASHFQTSGIMPPRDEPCLEQQVVQHRGTDREDGLCQRQGEILRRLQDAPGGLEVGSVGRSGRREVLAQREE